MLVAIKCRVYIFFGQNIAHTKVNGTQGYYCTILFPKIAVTNPVVPIRVTLVAHPRYYRPLQQRSYKYIRSSN